MEVTTKCNINYDMLTASCIKHSKEIKEQTL